jgi:hypothetical protein
MPYLPDAEVPLMRSLLRSLRAFFTLGVATVGCGKSDDPAAAPADVTLHVPGMN